MNLAPLPEHFSDIRPHQQQAREEIAELYAQGCEVVVVDAPTGSGKSLLGELARRDDWARCGGVREWDVETHHRAMYLCGTKGLQDQFAREFPYGRVIKGRANYPTQHGDNDLVTCDDCLGRECLWCDGADTCPYVMARTDAQTSDLTIANYAYLLGEANTSQRFSRNAFAIADECDLLEGELMRRVEFYVSNWRLERLGIAAPKKAVRKPTIVGWLRDQLDPAARKYITRLDPRDVRGAREIKALKNLCVDAGRLAQELEKDIAAKVDSEEDGIWVRDYPYNGGFAMKPVVVKRFGERMLWRHADRWLLMSATVVSAQEMVDSLGCGREWGLVTVPMTFPVGNRPVHMVPMGSMSRKHYDDTLPKIVRAVERLCERHKGEKVLVHTHTYKLAKELSAMCRLDGRPVFTYAQGRERDDAFARYAATDNAVMFAPSMDRGYDFAGDLARVVVIAKAPFPYLGDKQVSARMRMPGGQTWYTVQTVRSVVQMTGRGVRGKDDWCVSYVLDADVMKTLQGGDKYLYPQWWREAVNYGFPVRELL